MRLIPQWKDVLARAWSIRLTILASALSGAEVLISILADNPPLPRGTFAILAMLVTMGAGIARLVAQRDLPGVQ
ncbi:hypothetical protein HJG44_20520 [Enterovirga sp. DB1703]|uniref:Uncharacterized protein n=1 Tax=Enterovirga aerilata TaxID=2730920 RepID=A0A849IE69_9HYPH|nr:hypothetical protein [Enterovirga sp. DB1703]